jgi:hypothetical protein
MSPPVKSKSNGDDAKNEAEAEKEPPCLRIFIGGIDPLNGLTSAMVLDRLPKTGVTNVRLGSTYLHCTVQDLTQRALVQRTLHHCKWKQCKLTVEDAQDDFLTRLAHERCTEKKDNDATSKSPQAAASPSTEGTIATPTIDSKDPSSSLEVRRHWRVKRRFGAPMVLVDTHPKVVCNWTELRVNRNKKHYQNRSMHLKFNDVGDIVQDNVDADTSDDGVSSEDEDSTSSRVDASSVASSHSSRDNDSSLDQRDNGDDDHRVAKTSTSGTYVWSSSSSSDDESSSDDDKRPSDDEVADEPATAARLLNSGKSSQTMEPPSDDEENSVDDDNAISVSSESEPESNGSASKNDRDEHYDPETIDLSKDMEMNESVLAQLFPNAFPVVDTAVMKPQEAKAETKRQAATTTMVRYDPTDLSAQAKYELSDDDEDDDHDRSAAEISTNDKYGETIDMDTEETNVAVSTPDNVAALASPAETYIYEQGKLESVFKESREQEAMPHTQQPGVFSFGFDLPALPPDTTTKASSSSVSVPDEMYHGEQVQEVDEMETSQSEKDTTEPIDFAAATAVAKGPKLFAFPSDELLDSLNRQFFYGFDDGKRIADNLDEWRNDPTVRESWLERRAALTLDWKRKRKAGLAQRKQRDNNDNNKHPRTTAQRPRPRSDR